MYKRIVLLLLFIASLSFATACGDPDDKPSNDPNAGYSNDASEADASEADASEDASGTDATADAKEDANGSDATADATEDATEKDTNGADALDETDAGPPPEPIPLEDLPESLATRYCERIFRCCTTDEIIQVFNADEFSTEEECQTLIAQSFEADLREMRDAVDAGLLTYQGDKAAICINSVATSSCEEGLGGYGPPSDDAACEEVFQGTVANGDECQTWDECRDGDCIGLEFDDNDEVVTAGTCRGLGGPGDACEWSGHCQDGHYCDQSYDQDTQTYHSECKEIAAMGEPCTQGGCGDDAYCDVHYEENTSPSNTCKPRKALGEPCHTAECAAGSYCNANPSSSEMGSCVAPQPDGATCNFDEDCLSNNCNRSHDGPGGEFTCIGEDSLICTGSDS